MCVYVVCVLSKYFHIVRIIWKMCWGAERLEIQTMNLSHPEGVWKLELSNIIIELL